MKNIGLVFVRMGQYNDAVTAFEHIMSDKPDVESGTYSFGKAFVTRRYFHFPVTSEVLKNALYQQSFSQCFF